MVKAAAKKAAAKKTPAPAKRKAAPKTAAKKAPAQKSATSARTPAAPATTTVPPPLPLPGSGPKTTIAAAAVPNERPYSAGGFSRAGCFAISSPSKVAWASAHDNRVGWLSLDDGSWSDFWSRKYTRCIGVDGDLLVGTMKTGSKLEFVVVDPARGKKPVRYPSFAEDLADIAFSPSLVLTVQPDRKTSVPMVHLWDRASFKLSKVVPSCAAWRAAVSSSSAAVVVGDSGVVELWSDPWERARVVDTGFAGYQPVKALGFSSDGARLAVASIAEVVVVDVAAAKIIKRIACAPAGKEIEGPLRADHTSKTWVRPLLHDQLLVVDFARGVQLQEIVAELWDVAAGRRIASELVTLREGKGQGIAEQVAVSDDVVVINRDRIFRLS